jgi:hypothetical protein
MAARKTPTKPRHGHTVGRHYSPTYHSWQAMLTRCRHVERDTEAKHAARGISVNPRWETFDSFLADMGERPEGTTLDRIDNDGNYEPSNCRWATPVDQARNRRNARMTYERAYQACLMVLAGIPAREIASQFQCSESLPREIAKGRSWKDASAAAHEAWKREHG